MLEPGQLGSRKRCQGTARATVKYKAYSDEQDPLLFTKVRGLAPQGLLCRRAQPPLRGGAACTHACTPAESLVLCVPSMPCSGRPASSSPTWRSRAYTRRAGGRGRRSSNCSTSRSTHTRCVWRVHAEAALPVRPANTQQRCSRAFRCDCMHARAHVRTCRCSLRWGWTSRCSSRSRQRWCSIHTSPATSTRRCCGCATMTGCAVVWGGRQQQQQQPQQGSCS